MIRNFLPSNKAWMILLGLILIVAVQGWFTYRVIGDRGMPDWNYKVMQDVPGESVYTLTTPYHPLPTQQHVQFEPDREEQPLQILNLYETYHLEGQQP